MSVKRKIQEAMFAGVDYHGYAFITCKCCEHIDPKLFDHMFTCGCQSDDFCFLIIVQNGHHKEEFGSCLPCFLESFNDIKSKFKDAPVFYEVECDHSFEYQKFTGMSSVDKLVMCIRRTIFEYKYKDVVAHFLDLGVKRRKTKRHPNGTFEFIEGHP